MEFNSAFKGLNKLSL